MINLINHCLFKKSNEYWIYNVALAITSRIRIRKLENVLLVQETYYAKL